MPGLALLLILACGCSSSTGVPSDTVSTNPVFSVAENIYSNGFRLSKITVDNLLFDQLDAVTTLEYLEDVNQIIRTRTTDIHGESKATTRTLRVSDTGLLLGGTRNNGDKTTEFNYRYDVDGKLLEYDAGFYTLNFEYDDERVQRIDDGTYHVDFRYDANGRLVSTTDTVLVETTHLEYNADGRLVKASEVDQHGDAGYSFEYQYDAQGNLTQQTQIRPFGDIFQVSVYEYEFSERPMYNHQMFRLAMQPFYNVVFKFIID